MVIHKFVKQKNNIMRKLVFLFILTITSGVYIQAQEVTFKASAPETVVMGQQFQLVYSVNSEAKDLRVPDLSEEFEVLFGPSQSTSFSTQFVNGKSASETKVTYTYVLMPKQEGSFNIAPATIKAKNANYTSNALVVKVLPQDKAAEAAAPENKPQSGTTSGLSNDDIFLQMQVSKRSVYEQEALLVTFKLYSVNDVRDLANVKFPEFEGFLVQDIEIENIQVNLENYNNRNYRTYVLKQSLLYPQRSGKITIDAGKLDAVVRIRRQQQQRARSLFDEFIDQYQNVSKTLSTAPVTIDVKPLPSGKPASFSGAVGNFTMNTNISSTNVKANEAVTVNVKIDGTGNVKLIKNPEVTFPNDFDIFDPKIDVNTKITASGVTGSKSIEYMAIPRYGGEFEIPAIQFSYFDPKTESYKTLSSEAYKLQVEKGEGETSGGAVVSNFTNRENVKYLGQDIRYLKVKGIHFVTKGDVFFGSFTYYLCYLVPALLFIVFFFIYRRQVKENSNIALVRTKKANKTAVKRLKIAGKLLKENRKEEFYEEVLRAVWGYLSDKLNIPQSNLTKDNVEAELTGYGVDSSLINEFMEILNICEFARYAPSQASDAMDKLYKQTVEAIGKMENTIKK